MAELVLAGCVGAAGLLAFLRLPPLHPAQIWLLPWALAAVAFALPLLPYREVRWGTVALISICVFGFAAAATMAARGEPLWSAQIPRAVIGRAAPIAAALTLALTLLWCGLFVAQGFTDVGVRDTLTASADLRRGIGAGDYALTVKFVYAALAASALCAVTAGRAEGRLARVGWILATALSTGTIYFATGRATLFAGVVVAVTAFLLARGARIKRGRSLRFLAGLSVVFIVVFLVGGSLVGKTFENNPDLNALPGAFDGESRELPAWSALPYQYVTAPIAALDIQLEKGEPLGGSLGCATLPEACRALAAAGFDVSAVDRVREFTAPPLPWNTYTALDVPVLDWGWALAPLVMIAIGAICGRLYRHARSGSLIAISVYACLTPALLTGFNVFNFSAPQVLGAMLIAASALTGCALLLKTRSASTTATVE